jgi:hypothetical protein
MKEAKDALDLVRDQTETCMIAATVNCDKEGHGEISCVASLSKLGAYSLARWLMDQKDLREAVVCAVGESIAHKSLLG